MEEAYPAHSLPSLHGTLRHIRVENQHLEEPPNHLQQRHGPAILKQRRNANCQGAASREGTGAYALYRYRPLSLLITRPRSERKPERPACWLGAWAINFAVKTFCVRDFNRALTPHVFDCLTVFHEYGSNRNGEEQHWHQRPRYSHIASEAPT